MHRRSRGRVIIINNIKFNPISDECTLEPRDSAESDATEMKHSLTVLGYAEADIIVHTNVTANEMLSLLKNGN